LRTLFPVFEKIRNFLKNHVKRRNFDFFFNGKQGVQTARLDELSNIVTWANISFILKN